MATPGPGESRDDPEASQGKQQRVEYYHGAFLELASELHRDHPGEWFAIAIEHEDEETGHTIGRIIAHSPLDSLVICAIIEHRRKYPDVQIELFTTEIVDPVPRRER